jgi:hypothetical protein
MAGWQAPRSDDSAGVRWRLCAGLGTSETRRALGAEDRAAGARASDGTVHIIANEPDARNAEEYERKWADARAGNRLPADMAPLFLEVTVPDASVFASHLGVAGEECHGYRILTVTSPAVPNAIAAICLHLRDQSGILPHVYLEWAEGSPLAQFLRYIFLGSGQVAPVTREVLRRAEPDPARRPASTSPDRACLFPAACAGGVCQD